MKRFWIILSITCAIFLLTLSSIQMSQAQHEKLAKAYMSQGLYDEALQEYSNTEIHMTLFKSIIHLFGEFNAVLAMLGILFIISGFFLKKPTPKQVPQVRFNKNYHST